MNTKFIAAISIAAALATLLVYQAFVVGFVVSNQTTGSVVQIDSQSALLQIDPIDNQFASVSTNGGLSISLPAIAPGTADYAAEIDPGAAAAPVMYSAAYLFAIAEVEFNYPGNSNQQAALFANLENVQTNNLPIAILVLATPGSNLVKQLTNFPHNEIQIKAVAPGEVSINGQQFWVLATYGLPSNIASQIGNTSVTIESGASAGANIYFLVLLGSNGTILPNQVVTFSAALNLYGYQM